MKTVTLSISDSLAAQIEQSVAFYGYEGAAEYVADALREQEESRDKKLQELLLEGLNSGDPIPATAEFWAGLRNDTDALLIEHQQSLNKVSAA